MFGTKIVSLAGIDLDVVQLPAIPRVRNRVRPPGVGGRLFPDELVAAAS